MMDCQFLETLADKLFKNFSKKRLTNNHEMQSQNK